MMCRGDSEQQERPKRHKDLRNLQVIATLDKGGDTLNQQQHSSLTTRSQPLTTTQDDNTWTD
jgi:hypothetical protein